MRPIVSRHVNRILIATAAAAGLASWPVGADAANVPAPAQVAPGRVILPSFDGGAVRDNVDLGGPAPSVALPDGSALIIDSGGPVAQPGFEVVKIGPTGAVDASFGPGGAAFVGLPTAFGIVEFLRAPDGKLIVVGGGPQPRFRGSPLMVVRLNADGTLDRTFGSGGVAAAGIDQSCGGCAAVAADGSIVLTGQTGTYPTSITGTPNVHWMVARLTPTGAADPSFGSGGRVTVSTAPATGGDVALLPNGDILTEGRSATSLLPVPIPVPIPTVLLTALTPAGAPDPAYDGGAPIAVPFASGGADLLVESDGSVVLAGQRPGPIVTPPIPGPGRQLLARYTPTGTLDPTFGAGGVVDLGTGLQVTQLLPAPGRGALVVGTPSFSLASMTPPMPGVLDIERITTAGTVDPLLGTHSVTLPFGGGGSSFLISVRPRPLPPLAQNSFIAAGLTPRADGSYLAAGGVGVTTPTGEGTGRSIDRLAAAALTPAFSLDPSFGGPATPVHAVVHLVVQRAATALRTHGIRVVLQVSAPGLTQVTIKTHGRVIAQSMLPVFQTGRQILPVELTTYGNQYLRSHRGVSVTIAAVARDLLTNTARAAGTGDMP